MFFAANTTVTIVFPSAAVYSVPISVFTDGEAVTERIENSKCSAVSVSVTDSRVSAACVEDSASPEELQADIVNKHIAEIIKTIRFLFVIIPPVSGSLIVPRNKKVSNSDSYVWERDIV